MSTAGLYEILDGVEAELELERELGVRVFEFDRALLEPLSLGSGRVRIGSDRVEVGSSRVRLESDKVALGPMLSSASIQATPSQPQSTPPPPLSDPTPPLSAPNQTLSDPPLTLLDPNPPLSDPNRLYDFVFLHHAMLSSGGAEMMAKVVTAMKKTPATAPTVFVGERPRARIYIVLGGNALKKWFPELRCSPGQWAKGSKGEEVLVTYSPEYILRRGIGPAAVQKMKQEMWSSLKGVLQKMTN